MEGTEFMKKRVKIELLCERVDSFIQIKKLQKAKSHMQKVQNILTELKSHVTGNEIQERSVQNMEIKTKHLLNRMNNLEG
jgi:flagellin-specific chaperone FliS